MGKGCFEDPWSQKMNLAAMWRCGEKKVGSLMRRQLSFRLDILLKFVLENASVIRQGGGGNRCKVLCR